jgi:translation initiation factor 3 subunit C
VRLLLTRWCVHLCVAVQGPSAFKYRRDNEPDRRESRRRVADHTFIDLELLEAFHLLSAVLLEVPNVALADYDNRRHARLSYNFHKMTEERDRCDGGGLRPRCCR